MAETVRIDTAEIIFTRLFKCRIPNLQTMSEDYIRIFGMPTTGDAGIDNELANEWITTMLTIEKMAEYHKQNVQLKIVRYEDVKEIYDHISNHLQAWRHQIENGINIGDAPIEDLILLDDFANTVYDHAKYQFTRTMADSLLQRHLSGILRVNKHNFFKDDPTVTTTEDKTVINGEDEDKHPKRESLANIFKDRMIGNRRWN